MAYVGLIVQENLCKSDINENITGKWKFSNNLTFSGNNTFTGVNKFTQTIEGTALKAKYANLNGADIAERYALSITDDNYKNLSNAKLKGYMVELSRDTGEVVLTKPNSRNFFGIISSNPSITMNDDTKKTKSYKPIALLGRVPCYVVGKVNKGDKLTTSKFIGVAKRKTFLDTILGKPTIGYSLTNKEIIFNADNIWIALQIGLVSGASSTTTNQILKQVFKERGKI